MNQGVENAEQYCQGGDTDYVVGVAGEDRLVVGTDSGHHDTSTEIEAMRLLGEQNLLGPQVIDKILGANATTLYGLD
jgi:predicted TIM-barrel fold metal-dependent hydrolase